MDHTNKKKLNYNTHTIKQQNVYKKIKKKFNGVCAYWR